MKSAGVILTYMVWKDWKQWWFNIPLLIGQLMFLIVGTAYGKIRWEKASTEIRVVSLIGAIAGAMGGINFFMAGWPILPYVGLIISVINIVNFRNIPWRRVWRAAQCSHVRLVLQKRLRFDEWLCINFGYPKAELQPWRERWIDGKRFRYFGPTFPTPPQFMEPVIQYAYDQVGKPYDELQLISSGLHLIAWIVYPPCWGKELKIIKAFNRKGGSEHCISGLVACLRWGETREKFEPINTKLIVSNYYYLKTIFFTGYSTATTFPCQVDIDENWREG